MGIERAVERRVNGSAPSGWLRETEVTALRNEMTLLQEDFETALQQLRFEDRGWELLYGNNFDKDRGPDLTQVKEVAEKNRTYVAGHPLIKHAQILRTSYIHTKGLIIPGYTPLGTKRRSGRPSALDTFCNKPLNRKALFGEDAALQMEQSLITDGVFFLVGDNRTKELRSITLAEIANVYVNPDYPDEIWAYLREWSSYNPNTGKTTTEREWIYTDEFTGVKKSNINVGGKDIRVNKDKTIFDLWVNRQNGWTFGAGDAMTAVVWVRTYTELVMNGKTMTDALAQFAAKVKVKSKAGSDRVGVTVSRNRGAGQVSTYGEGNDIDVFQSAGKTYDFNGLRPIAALVAAGMDVSIVHLLSDPGAAGSSYGSASNLDLPQKRAMVLRQNQWKAFDKRVLKWGTNEDVDVSFPSLDEPDPYRDSQTIALAWQTGAFHPDEIRPRMAQAANITLTKDSAPAGILLPNNEKSLPRKDIDTEGSSTGTQAASPDQGRSNGAGNADSALGNDERTDTIGEMLRQAQREDFLERFEGLVQRAEAIGLSA